MTRRRAIISNIFQPSEFPSTQIEHAQNLELYFFGRVLGFSPVFSDTTDPDNGGEYGAEEKRVRATVEAIVIQNDSGQ